MFLDDINSSVMGALGQYMPGTQASALVILILFAVFAFLASSILGILIKHIASRTKTELDDKLLEGARAPIFWLIIITGFYISVESLGISGGFNDTLLKLIVTAAYIVVMRFAIHEFNVFVDYGLKPAVAKSETKLDDELLPLFQKTAVALIYMVVAIFILAAWGIDIGPLLAGLGIAGLAVSLALQDTLSNIFSGISLVLDKTFRVGDKIEVNGIAGFVQEITIRSVKVRTFDNEVMIFPNKMLANTNIKNFKNPHYIPRVFVDFGVEYGQDPESVKSVALGAVSSLPGISDDSKPAVFFMEMGDSALKFRAVFWVDDPAIATDKKFEATERLYYALGKAGIAIAYPSMSVYMKGGDGGAEPRRKK